MYRYIYWTFKNRTILRLNHIIATSKSITYCVHGTNIPNRRSSPSPRPSPPADEGRISKNTLLILAFLNVQKPAPLQVKKFNGKTGVKV